MTGVVYPKVLLRTRSSGRHLLLDIVLGTKGEDVV